MPRIYSLVICTVGPLMAAVPQSQASINHKDKNSVPRNVHTCRSQWPRAVLRRGFAAARLLGLRVRMPPDAWLFVSCVYVLSYQVEVSASGWSLVARRPSERGVSEYDRGTSTVGRTRPSMAVETWKKNGHTHTHHFLIQVCSNAAYLWSTV